VVRIVAVFFPLQLEDHQTKENMNILVDELQQQRPE
jgi:hypothetical protein